MRKLEILHRVNTGQSCHSSCDLLVVNHLLCYNYYNIDSWLCFNYDLHIFHVIIIFADNNAMFIACISCPQGTKAIERCQNRHLASIQTCFFFSLSSLSHWQLSIHHWGGATVKCIADASECSLFYHLSQSFVRCRIRLSKETLGSSGVFSLSLCVSSQLYDIHLSDQNFSIMIIRNTYSS